MVGILTCTKNCPFGQRIVHHKKLLERGFGVYKNLTERPTNCLTQFAVSRVFWVGQKLDRSVTKLYTGGGCGCGGCKTRPWEFKDKNQPLIEDINRFW